MNFSMAEWKTWDVLSDTHKSYSIGRNAVFGICFEAMSRTTRNLWMSQTITKKSRSDASRGIY